MSEYDIFTANHVYVTTVYNFLHVAAALAAAGSGAYYREYYTPENY